MQKVPNFCQLKKDVNKSAVLVVGRLLLFPSNDLTKEELRHTTTNIERTQ
jgi:hypothetical protein